MKYLVFIFTVFAMTLQAATPQDTNLTKDNSETNLTKIYIPTFYKDYKWDVGLISGLTFDGKQVDIQRFSFLAGIHGAYHINDFVSIHGAYLHALATVPSGSYSPEQKDIFEDTDIDTVAISAAFDFSAERTYSLFAKAGLGYEHLNFVVPY